VGPARWIKDDIEYGGCGRKQYREENLDDQAEIFFLEDENR
jgi:hypothetical protein